MSGLTLRLQVSALPLRIGAACASVILAVGLRLLVLPVNQPPSYITVYPAVVLSFMLLGAVPGTLAGLAGGAAGLWLYLEAGGASRPWMQGMFATVLYGLACALIGILSVRLQDALRRAETATREAEQSERRYRLLVEDQGEMVSLVDRDGRLQLVNVAYARLFGKPAAEMIGTHILDYIREEDRPAMTANLAEVWSHGIASTSENRMQAADGSGPRWVAWTHRRLSGTEYGQGLIHSVGRDITEEKTLQTQLQAKAQETEDLYDNAPCGYHSIGANAVYLKVNATELGWLGCSREEVVGQRTPADFLGPIDQEVLALAFGRLKAELSAQRVDVRLIGRHGIERDVSIDMSVVLDDDGTFLMTRSVMYDVSDLYDARRALLRLNQEQRVILESDLFGMAKLKSRRFLWANPGLHRMLGFRQGELTDLSTREVYADPETWSSFGASAYPALAKGETYRTEIPMRRRDGVAVWIEMAGVLLDGGAEESLWLFVDITARKRAELALRSSQAMLERTGAVAGVGGWEYDVAGATLLWTEETCRLHGVPVGSVLSIAQALDFYVPESRDQVQAAIDAALTTGAPYDLEVEIHRPDGERRWVRTAGTVEYQDGRPSRLFGAFQDVTAKVAQIAHIEQLYRLAEQQREELAIYRDRAQAEAEIASFLLSRLSRVELLDKAGVQYYWEPADAFSGDIIGVAKSSAGDTYGLLADATGHGLAAAINLIPLTSAFYAMAEKGFGLVTIADHLNKVVKDYSLADRFVAVTLCCLRHRELRLEVVNAGNPAALLLGADRSVIREFRSGSVPLGILAPSAFKPVVESSEWSSGAALVMFSDGLIEAADPQGTAFGRAGLDGALAAAPAVADVSAAIRHALLAHADGTPPADDVSLLVLPLHVATAPLEAEPASQLASEWSESTVTKDDHDGMAAGRWSLELRFSSSELKSLEVVPEVVDLSRTFKLSRSAEAPMFTVLSEMYQNALEHGLLRLDSQLKGEPDGFERYLALREARLAELRDGEILVRVAHQHLVSGGGRLRICVQDSGPGFNHQATARSFDSTQDPQLLHKPSGRGLALLARLCDSVSFNASGNQVTVELSYP